MSKSLKQIALNTADLNHRFAKNMVSDNVYYYMGAALHFETLFTALGIEYKPISAYSEYNEAKEVCREHLRHFQMPGLVDTEEKVEF